MIELMPIILVVMEEGEEQSDVVVFKTTKTIKVPPCFQTINFIAPAFNDSYLINGLMNNSGSQFKVCQISS